MSNVLLNSAIISSLDSDAGADSMAEVESVAAAAGAKAGVGAASGEAFTAGVDSAADAELLNGLNTSNSAPATTMTATTLMIIVVLFFMAIPHFTKLFYIKTLRNARVSIWCPADGVARKTSSVKRLSRHKGVS